MGKVCIQVLTNYDLCDGISDVMFSSLKTILEEKYGLFWFIRISLYYENTNGLDKSLLTYSKSIGKSSL